MEYLPYYTFPNRFKGFHVGQCTVFPMDPMGNAKTNKNRNGYSQVNIRPPPLREKNKASYHETLVSAVVRWGGWGGVGWL